MDQMRALGIIAIIMALAALILAGYSIASDNNAAVQSDNDENFYSDMVEQLNSKGGALYTMSGTKLEKVDGNTFSIQGHSIVFYSATYDQYLYVPFTSVDHVTIKG